MILLAIVLAVAIFGGLVVFLTFGGLVKVEADQQRAEKNAQSILDEAFDGRSDVTFSINARSLKYETVMVGAKVRGYTLANQAGTPSTSMTLLFEKS